MVPVLTIHGSKRTVPRYCNLHSNFLWERNSQSLFAVIFVFFKLFHFVYFSREVHLYSTVYAFYICIVVRTSNMVTPHTNIPLLPKIVALLYVVGTILVVLKLSPGGDLWTVLTLCTANLD